MIWALGGFIVCGLLAVFFGLKLLFHRIDSLQVQLDGRMNEGLKTQFQSLERVADRLENLHHITGQVVELSQGIKEVSAWLQAPKLRGLVGEFQLGEILRQVLPADSYEEQYAILPQSREAVDAVIKFKEGVLCIDSKFPMASYQLILSAVDQAAHEKARKAFFQDVRTMASSIAKKYIIPQKTLDFAMMFIPAETIFHEVISNVDLHQECLSKKVIPVSPNSFYAYLQALALGLRGLKIQEQAQKIEQVLRQIRHDGLRALEDLSKLGKHVKDASMQYENVERRLTRTIQSLDRADYWQEMATAPSPTAEA